MALDSIAALSGRTRLKDAIIEHLRSVAPVAWTIGTIEKKFGLDGLSEAFDALDAHPDIAREVSLQGLAYRYVGKPTEEVKYGDPCVTCGGCCEDCTEERHCDYCIEERPAACLGCDCLEEDCQCVLAPPLPPVRDARYHVVRAATEFEGYQIDRRSAVGKYILAGEHLLEARKVAAHGEWGPLLDEFGLTPPTAWRMMRLAESGLTADAVIELGGIREATKSFTVKDLEEQDEGWTCTTCCERHSSDWEFCRNDCQGQTKDYRGQMEPEPLHVDGPGPIRPIYPVPPIASPERMADDLDSLESENHDLRQEVQQQRQPKPTKYDKLQLEFDGLKSELYTSRERSESLEERVKFLESEQAPDHERETTFHRYRAEISSLRASQRRMDGQAQRPERLAPGRGEAHQGVGGRTGWLVNIHRGLGNLTRTALCEPVKRGSELSMVRDGKT